MSKKNILFYGFDPNLYINKLWELLRENDSYNSFKFEYELENQKIIIDRYEKLKFRETIAPSIHSEEFHKYFLTIQRRKKDFELHESYCEWQINFSYFSNFLIEKKIDIIIFANCPHQGIDIALWYAGKQRNLETVFFWQVPLFYSLTKTDDINGKFLFSSSIEDHDLICKDKIFKSLKKKVNLNENYRKLSIAFVSSQKKKNLSFYEFIRTLKFYTLFRKYSLKNFIRHLFALLILKKSVRKHFLYLKNLISSISIKTEDELNYSKPYIYFPLHWQPEMTTSILGGKFTEISDAILLLAKYAEERGINILVKENPRQTHFQRGGNFFRRLNKSKNVKFVSTSIGAESLISNSCGIATITGSTALEAIFSSKHSFVFGNPWFKKCKAIHTYQNKKDIHNFLDAIELGDPDGGEEVLNNFLFDLAPKLCDGVIDPYYLNNCHKDDFDIPLNETYQSILKCLNIKFGI